MSRRLRLTWWAFVAIIATTTVLISAAEVGIAERLDSRVGVAGVLAACGLVFAVLLWVASKLDK